ncbi:MAG: Fic family protein [Firmicutes bacterium]|nr:Fic family protein [Bacillota bacterium]
MINYLPLEFIDGHRLKIREDRFAQTKEELELFLEGQRHLHTKAFAKDVMFSHEIKANNLVEGYTDDVSQIKAVIEKMRHQPQTEQAKRIINLYHGYNYILKNYPIDQETLKKLYSILSKKLLEPQDFARMGPYYRKDKVFILKKGRLDVEPDEGVPSELIEKFMQAYFNFLNSLDFSQSITDEYIKSQILHFYFVYIHPYFDVNGRTSRTVAMWYLLKKKAYPYIIFNRGITFEGTEYDKVIEDAKKYHDISFFIDYMLKTVQTELEKEYIMQSIANCTNAKLSSTDWQTLLYLLSMNGLITASDFVATYNRYNDKLRPRQIYETMLDSLYCKGILEVERTTQSYMFNDKHNEVIRFNPQVMQYDHNKIKRLVKFK